MGQQVPKGCKPGLASQPTARGLRVSAYGSGPGARAQLGYDPPPARLRPRVLGGRAGSRSRDPVSGLGPSAHLPPHSEAVRNRLAPQPDRALGSRASRQTQLCDPRERPPPARSGLTLTPVSQPPTSLGSWPRRGRHWGAPGVVEVSPRKDFLPRRACIELAACVHLSKISVDWL